MPPACEIAGISTTVGGVAELLLEVGAIRPDLVVAELPDLDDAGLVTLESTLGASPSTWMILLSPVQSPEFQLRAIGFIQIIGTAPAEGSINVSGAFADIDVTVAVAAPRMSRESYREWALSAEFFDAAAHPQVGLC